MQGYNGRLDITDKSRDSNCSVLLSSATGEMYNQANISIAELKLFNSELCSDLELWVMGLSRDIVQSRDNSTIACLHALHRELM